MSEFFKGIPYAPPVNLARLDTFAENLKAALELKRAEYWAKKSIKASGAHPKIGRSALMRKMEFNNSRLLFERVRLEDRVDHAIVIFLRPRILMDIDYILTKVSRWKTEVRDIFKLNIKSRT